MTKRSYNQEFLDLGFTSINDRGAVKPQCVLCYEVLSNESLKKKKSEQHLEMKHPQHVKKKLIFFEHIEAALKQSLLCSATSPTLLNLK